MHLRVTSMVVCLMIASFAGASTADIHTLQSVSGVGPTAKAVPQAWKQVAAMPVADVTAILESMKGVNPTAENWLRTAADTVVQRAKDNGKPLPVKKLQTFLRDRTQSPRARRAAYEWLVDADSSTPEAFLPEMLDDPSLELRYDAVERLIKQATKEGTSEAKQKELLSTALNAALDQGQLNKCARRLGKLGEEIDLTIVMAYLTDWKIIGPFDNTGEKGFNVAYPPESELNLTASYEGKGKQAEWADAEAEGVLGQLDITDTLGPEKGAVAYLYTTFNSSEERPAQVRNSSSNATKIWLNGRLVASNEVYHAGSAVDQYRADVKLKKGENTVLVKVCQNEQKEPWAQGWDIQLRFTDKLGKGIHAAK